MNISTLPDCPLNIDPSSYSCSNPYPNCTNPAAFQFASLWIITQAIASCPDDTRLFNGLPMLTEDFCKITTRGIPWTPYPAADIWSRLTTWKFPLLQLVAVFPRPPLSYISQVFVLVHLLGDPISTIKSLLLKVASCQARAMFWKDKIDSGNIGLMGHLLDPLPLHVQPGLTTLLPQFHSLGPSREGIWKGLAAIVDSYDEWGVDVGSATESFILDRLTTSTVSDLDQREFLKICQDTAKSLAADRSTKFLPIIVAQCFFIATIAIAFGRTKDSSSGPNPATYINIEGHSIAFSSLYFWIIPAVMISSIIGVSQTEDSIPSKLRDFKSSIHAKFPDWDLSLLEDELTTEFRERSGGIYSCHPKESRIAVENTIRMNEPDRIISGLGYFDMFWQRVMWIATLKPGSPAFPLVILIYSALTSILISLLIPPVGFDCRNIGEILIALTWILSACLNDLPIFPGINSDNEVDVIRARRSRFLFILWKDIVVTALTMGGIIVTQIGVFNRCECYTSWGRTGLMLPENSSVNKILFWRISTSYPAIAFVCVAFQLVIVPLLLLKQYGLAVRVFLQRDDDKSNLPRWVARFGSWLVLRWEVIAEIAKKIRKGIFRALLNLRRGPEVIQRAPRAEYATPSPMYIGKSSEIVEYRDVELSEVRG